MDKHCWLYNKPIAHRGLWNNQILENSITSYKNAIDNGYPIEIDVFSSTDGVLYSFHDDSLKRVTGIDGNIFDKTSYELDKLKLFGSNEKIPKLNDLLNLCENKIPLLIEIKNQPDKKIVEKVIDALKNYKGEFAIQSFNPLYIKKVKKLAPNIIRGILSTNSKADLKGQSFINKFVIKHMALNFLIKPDFISCSCSCIPLPKRRIKNKCVIAWTVTDEITYNEIKPYVDNVIFESFMPEIQHQNTL